MTLLKSFCVFCKLDTAACIIGWADLALSVIGCILSSIIYCEIDLMFPGDNPKFSWIIHHWRMAFGSLIGYNIICLAMCIMLMRGIIKKKRLFFVPWLFVRCLTLIILIFMVLTFGGFLFPTDEYSLGIFIYMFGFALSGFLIYCWLCVLSLYQSFDTETFSSTTSNSETDSFVHKI